MYKTVTFININSNISNNLGNFIIFINLNNMKAKFIGKAKLTKQGQLTLPLEARKDLRINNEDELYWYLIDNHLVVVKDLMSIEDLVKKLSKKKR